MPPRPAVRGATRCRRGLEVPPPFRRCEAPPNVVGVLKCRRQSGDAGHCPPLKGLEVPSIPASLGLLQLRDTQEVAQQPAAPRRRGSATPSRQRTAPRSPTSRIEGIIARAQRNPPASAGPMLIRTSARSAEGRMSAALASKHWRRLGSVVPRAI